MSGVPFSATLETLKAKHDRVRPSDQKAKARLQARKLAATLGAAVPDWAALQERAGKRTPQQSPQRVTPWRSNKREPGPTVAVSSVLPDALRAWRERNAPRGAVVHLGQHGVALITLDDRQTFPTIADAIEAIQPTRKQA